MAYLWHKTYAEWLASLHGAEVIEVFDTQMDVERDPCGAHWAIQHMATEISRLTAGLSLWISRAEQAEAERDTAHTTADLAARDKATREQALREAAREGYIACAETRHVTLGLSVENRILALI